MPRASSFPKTVFSALVVASFAPPGFAQSDEAALRDVSEYKIAAAQLRSAVASRTLTWLTGTSANNDYISVGRMANYFGFVALRVSSGHSLTRAHVARDTLAALDVSQIDRLVALMNEETEPHAATQAARIEMNRALERLLVGEEVTEEEFLLLGRTYGAEEAELGRVIAQRFGDVAVTLTPGQKARLKAIREAHVAGQSDTLTPSDTRLKLPDVDRQELVNLGARFLSWTTGTPALNDFEVVGKPSQHFGFVSLRLASGHSVRRGAVAGEVLDLLTTDQKQMLEVAVQQNVRVFEDFLAERAKLMRELEVALRGEVIDPEAVRLLGAEIGEVEARMTWAQANAVLHVRDSLSAEQLDALVNMRAKYTVAEADGTPRDGLDLGRQLFARCVLCHAPSRADAIAPSLEGIVGREIAGDAEYENYSPALRQFSQKEKNWNIDLLNVFLASPRGLVPGTRMGFDGFENEQDRAAILEYLTTLK